MRDSIDALLRQAGWVVQSARRIDLNAGSGQAVREHQTDIGPADYVLFTVRGKKAMGVIEAKREDEGQRLTGAASSGHGFDVLMFSFSPGQYRIDVVYPNYESMLAARRQYEGKVLHEGDLVEFERRSCSLQITRPIIPRFVTMKINYELMTII